MPSATKKNVFADLLGLARHCICFLIRFSVFCSKA